MTERCKFDVVTMILNLLRRFADWQSGDVERRRPAPMHHPDGEQPIAPPATWPLQGPDHAIHSAPRSHALEERAIGLRMAHKRVDDLLWMFKPEVVHERGCPASALRIVELPEVEVGLR